VCVLLLYYVPSGLSGCWFRGLGSEFGPLVMSNGPEVLFGCICGGGSLEVGRDWCVVNSAFQHGRIELRCEQARAAEKGVEYKIGGGIERGFSFYGFMSFCCICRLSREGFHFSFVAYVWGWPYRLSTSRVRATRRREPALYGAGSGLSFVDFDRCIFVRSPAACGVFPCVLLLWTFCRFLFLKIYHGGVPLCRRVVF
jgi:hypothetical protein